MQKITTVGLDLAKSVFHVICCNEHGKVIRKKRLRRSEVIRFFSQMSPCLVGMEACSGAHYWAHQLTPLGHQVKLIPAQYVKPFVHGNKNDYNDALAIAEAVVRASMRFVTPKTTAQQDMQSLHRLRERRAGDRRASHHGGRQPLGRHRGDAAGRRRWCRLAVPRAAGREHHRAAGHGHRTRQPRARGRGG